LRGNAARSESNALKLWFPVPLSIALAMLSWFGVCANWLKSLEV
jgi:hypothetical protein